MPLDLIGSNPVAVLDILTEGGIPSADPTEITTTTNTTAATLGALWSGAPGAVVLSTPVYCGLSAILTKEALAELNGSFSELWSEMWPMLAATAAMAAVVLLLREIIFAGRTELPLVELILLTVTGAVIYLGTLFTLGRTVIEEGVEVLGWMLRRRRGLD